MKALIETILPVYSIASWSSELQNGVTVNLPVWEPIPNSARIAQIEDSEFEVAPDNLLWVDCNTSINCLDYYYDTSDSTIKAINHVAAPSE